MVFCRKFCYDMNGGNAVCPSRFGEIAEEEGQDLEKYRYLFEES